MANTEHDSILDAWANDLEDEVVTELTDTAASKIAESAAATALATAGGAGAAVAGSSAAFASTTVGKVLIATVLTVFLGGGIAAVNGVLPDPIQKFVADVGESIGIDLPRPELQVPDPSLVTIPTLPELPADTDDLLDPDAILPGQEDSSS